MPKYVIERDIPGIGNSTPGQFLAVSQQSCGVLYHLGPKIQWLHSYVTADKIYCVYIAPDEKTIREHAKQGASRQTVSRKSRWSSIRRPLNPDSVAVPTASSRSRWKHVPTSIGMSETPERPFWLRLLFKSKLGSNLGPSAPEYRRKRGYNTQNKPKRNNSLVHRLVVRDQGVGGSNPLSPTILVYNLAPTRQPPKSLLCRCLCRNPPACLPNCPAESLNCPTPSA